MRAVRESADATAVADIKPVHRPTSLASEDKEMYDGLRSSKALRKRLANNSSTGISEHVPYKMSEL